MSDRQLAEQVYYKKREEFMRGVEAGVVSDPRLPLKTIMKEYIDLHARPQKRSYRDDELILARVAKFFGEDTPIRQINPHALELYRTERLKTVSPSRVNREMAVVRSMFSKAILWGRMTINPAKQIKAMREDNRKERFLSLEEKSALLSNASDELRPILVMALNTGMRQGEMLALKWADVNLDQNLIFIAHSKSGKTRHVPINSQLAEMLKRLPKRGEHVFSDESGIIRSRHGGIRSSFERLVKKLGITNFRFHDLRHTFASDLAVKGVDIVTISQLLGHSSTRMSERYMHVSPNHRRVAVELLNPPKMGGKCEYSVNVTTDGVETRVS